MTDQSLGDLDIPQITSVDLRSVEVYQHFVSGDRSTKMLTFLLALDRFDRWAVDYNETTSPELFDIQIYLQELGHLVESAVAVLHRVPQQLAELLAHVTTSRCMYLLRYIGQHNPKFLDNLAFLVENDGGVDPNIAVIRRRFEAFGKAKMLGEIFSGERLNRIVSVMERYK